MKSLRSVIQSHVDEHWGNNHDTTSRVIQFGLYIFDRDAREPDTIVTMYPRRREWVAWNTSNGYLTYGDF